MNKEFLSYELAIKLKQLGFDELCFAHYFNGDLITQKAILTSSSMQHYQQDNINPTNQYKDKVCTAPTIYQTLNGLVPNVLFLHK